MSKIGSASFFFIDLWIKNFDFALIYGIVFDMEKSGCRSFMLHTSFLFTLMVVLKINRTKTSKPSRMKCHSIGKFCARKTKSFSNSNIVAYCYGLCLINLFTFN